MRMVIEGITLLITFLVPALAQEVKPFRETVVTYYHQIADQHLPALVVWLQAAADQAGLKIDVAGAFEKAFQDTFNSDLLDGEAIVQTIQNLIGGIFTAIFGLSLVFILTSFILLDWPKIEAQFWDLIPERHRQWLAPLIEELDQDLSGSIRGQITICLINGVLTTAGLLLLEVKYAATLGVIAGVFSIVPVFGSVLSTVPIVLVSLTVSFLMALKALAVIIFIHLFEANFLNPKVLGHHVELHPAIILFSIVVAEHWLGTIGLLAGVPIAATLRSIIRFGYHYLTDATDPTDPSSPPEDLGGNKDPSPSEHPVEPIGGT